MPNVLFCSYSSDHPSTKSRIFYWSQWWTVDLSGDLLVNVNVDVVGVAGGGIGGRSPLPHVAVQGPRSYCSSCWWRFHFPLHKKVLIKHFNPGVQILHFD